MRIIEKRKGKQIYYYLQHTFREGGRIKAKEIYLGKSIPKNIREIEEKFRKEIKKGLYGKLENIRKHFQKEWKKIPNSARKRELGEIAIAFTYNTNAIEGSTITLEETRGIVQDKFSPNKPLRDIKETEAHARVFFEMVSKRENISNALLLRWHKQIFQDTKPDIAGEYRDYLVRIGAYLAPDWQNVAGLMGKLIYFIKNVRGLNIVELVAIAHFRFEKIHPFGDGNGRIGRLLMNYLLWWNKYPMLIIEYKGRKPYYKSLQRGEDAFVKYFIRRYLSVHKRFIV